MVLTFDVFNKRNKLYKITGTITIITALFLSTMVFFNVKTQTPTAPIIDIPIDILIVACSFTGVFFIIIVMGGLIKSYIKEGELVLADDYLIIDSLKIPLNEVKDLSFKVTQRSKKKSGNTLSNHIELIDQNGTAHKNRFVIKSYDDNDEFERLLSQWQTTGAVFKWTYNSF